MVEQMRRGAQGAALYDAALAPAFAEDWLQASSWRARGAAEELAGGRGGALRVRTPVGACVLRHYRRGGWIARLSVDGYLWQGAARTRSFREFRLLAEMAALGLPVPAVVAAGYRRQGFCYRAVLLTRELPAARSLAQQLAGQLPTAIPSAPMAAVGTLIARFHQAGFWHADLNAHNILDTAAGWHLIDFDRCRRRPPAARWQQANLARLRRSLLKLGLGREGMAVFETRLWQPLAQAYRRELSA